MLRELEVDVGEAMVSLGGPRWQNRELGRDTWARHRNASLPIMTSDDHFALSQTQGRDGQTIYVEFLDLDSVPGSGII